MQYARRNIRIVLYQIEKRAQRIRVLKIVSAYAVFFLYVARTLRKRGAKRNRLCKLLLQARHALVRAIVFGVAVPHVIVIIVTDRRRKLYVTAQCGFRLFQILVALFIEVGYNKIDTRRVSARG